MQGITISETAHGTADARRYTYECAFLMRGLKKPQSQEAGQIDYLPMTAKPFAGHRLRRLAGVADGTPRQT
jgi:hypothetical protein